MKRRELFKEIKNIFVMPVKRYYLGFLRYGTPYFYPRGFVSSIIKVKKLTRKTEEELEAWLTKYSYLKDKDDYYIYNNFPVIRRSKFWVIKDWYIEIGSPIKIKNVELGWKDKYGTPRFEFGPSFIIFFFNLQFCIFWNSPDNDNDAYYEMILWWLYYSNKDIEIAKNTYPWRDYTTKESSWNNKYLK